MYFQNGTSRRSGSLAVFYAYWQIFFFKQFSYLVFGGKKSKKSNRDFETEINTFRDKIVVVYKYYDFKNTNFWTFWAFRKFQSLFNSFKKFWRFSKIFKKNQIFWNFEDFKFFEDHQNFWWLTTILTIFIFFDDFYFFFDDFQFLTIF